MKKVFLFSALISINFFCKAQSWENLAGGMSSLLPDVNRYVKAFTIYNGNLVAGGNFYSPGSDIASWDGTAWSSLGIGIRYNNGNTNVESLIVYNGDVIVGGLFDSAGGAPANYLAKWNGSSWAAFNGINQQVIALTLYNSNLIAGGGFDSADGLRANYIASWNGTSWTTLGTGMNSGVSALIVYNGNLIAAGNFTLAGGTPANYIASWNGTSWSPLGSGTNSGIVALAIYNGNLYAGGYFDSAGGNRASYVAEWNGTSWSALGSGMNEGIYNAVFSLGAYNGNLIAGGEFDSAGGAPANNIAQWNGTAWSTIGFGMHGPVFPSIVYSLTTYNGSLIAGGYFDSAGGKQVNNIAEWCPTCPAGVNEITENNEVNIYPNPSNGKFTIAFSHPELVSGSQTIQVYNMLGEYVYDGTLKQSRWLSGQGDNLIDISSEPDGIYLYRILTETGNLVSQGKLIIQK